MNDFIDWDIDLHPEDPKEPNYLLFWALIIAGVIGLMGYIWVWG